MTGSARTTQLSLRSSLLPEVPDSVKLQKVSEGVASTGAAGRETSTSRQEHDDDDNDRGVLSSSAMPTYEQSPQSETNATHIAWHGQFFFIGRRKPVAGRRIPSIHVYSTQSSASSSSSSPSIATISSPGLRRYNPENAQGIAEMKLDGSKRKPDEGVRLAVFYTSGQFSVFTIHNLLDTGDVKHKPPITFIEDYFHEALPTRPTVSAQFYSPLIVTLAEDRTVRFRLLEGVQASEEEREGKDETDKVHTAPSKTTTLSVSSVQPSMRSLLCFAPMVMHLEPARVGGRGKQKHEVRAFRLSLAYSTPYYPCSFTVGIQLFDIHIPRNSSSTSSRPSRLHISARHATAIPPMQSTTLVPSTSTANRLSRALQAVVTSIEHDGPYIVTSKSDNTISIYEVIDSLAGGTRAAPASTSTSKLSAYAASSLQIRHVRTLFGHTASVDAIGIRNGRCVSTGRDGLRVWELPQPEALSAPYSPPSTELYNVPLVYDDEAGTSAAWDIPAQQVSERIHGEKEEEEPRLSAPRCQWLGLDSSRIVTLSADERSGHESVKVYSFE